MLTEAPLAETSRAVALPSSTVPKTSAPKAKRAEVN
jgi:hypothetical protein